MNMPPDTTAKDHQRAARAAVTNPSDENLRLLTADQAASLFQVSPFWLRKKATARAIPCTFVGRHLRFSTADLAEIIRQGAQPSDWPHRSSSPPPRP